jgi:hypothetical protein
VGQGWRDNVSDRYVERGHNGTIRAFYNVTAGNAEANIPRIEHALPANARVVYTLWHNPGIVPLLYTPSFVVEKLQGGADLMTPGLQRGPPFPKKATKGMYDRDSAALCGLRYFSMCHITATF